jgi:hypothetical protein
VEYLDEELDVTAQKINNLEKELDITRHLLEQTINSLKETQRYLMKLAYTQADLTKKVSTWPFITVSDKDE